MSLIGVVYGTLLINFGKTIFSESFPELWLFLMGGLFIAVVMFFPNGLAGLWQDYGHHLTNKLTACKDWVASQLSNKTNKRLAEEA